MERNKKIENVVTPRKRRVSRNSVLLISLSANDVTPRKRRVSRNDMIVVAFDFADVTPRKRRVSRNFDAIKIFTVSSGHASQEACE